MPRPPVADFVDAFFTGILFQSEDELAASVLSAELSPKAEININGNSLNSETFISLITTQFRPTFTASIISIKDLNIVSTDNDKTTGIVAQYTTYETKNKLDGTILRQSATTIVKVEESDGKKVITALWEAQTVDEV